MRLARICGASLSGSPREPDRVRATEVKSALAVHFLFDPVLLELLVEVAARGINDFGRLRNVPAVLAKLLHQIRPFGRVLELPERAGAGRGRLGRRGVE